MQAVLQTLGWLAAIVYSTVPAYWLLVHPRADFWRRLTHAPLRLLGPLWALIWVAVGLITAPWRRISLSARRYCTRDEAALRLPRLTKPTRRPFTAPCPSCPALFRPEPSSPA